MGLVNVVYASIGGSSHAIPAYNGVPIASEDLTSSGVSAEATPATVDCWARIATDTAIYVKVGPAGTTAAAGDAWLVAAAAVLDLWVPSTFTVAVVDA